MTKQWVAYITDTTVLGYVVIRTSALDTSTRPQFGLFSTNVVYVFIMLWLAEICNQIL